MLFMIEQNMNKRIVVPRIVINVRVKKFKAIKRKILSVIDAKLQSFDITTSLCVGHFFRELKIFFSTFYMFLIKPF